GAQPVRRARGAATGASHRPVERRARARLDLCQPPSVGRLVDLDAVTAGGGALEALVEARRAGLVRWLGIPGHTHDAPRTHLEALRRFDFDTVMFPLNFVLWAIPEYRTSVEALLAECARRDVGVHIIKTVAKDPWDG